MVAEKERQRCGVLVIHVKAKVVRNCNGLRTDLLGYHCTRFFFFWVSLLMGFQLQNNRGLLAKPVPLYQFLSVLVDVWYEDGVFLPPSGN